MIGSAAMHRLATAFEGGADRSGGEAGSSGSEESGPAGQGLLLLIPLMLGLNGKVQTCSVTQNQLSTINLQRRVKVKKREGLNRRPRLMDALDLWALLKVLIHSASAPHLEDPQ